ncbi:PTS sugar transporter subunit IIA [Hylemonella gracilis]|uniref:PTS sugar transporter subunit IIA n=1 Tax=Hylemonella gracilis TaxID=80880 RepID=A0A4P6UHE1_9BURK|nr:PTS sugar transporter subunit IIA [Hylemonella gracilis]QBK03395.1 PTS sugar transporter subunit IIA [Hylemonella gracilis]
MNPLGDCLQTGDILLGLRTQTKLNLLMEISRHVERMHGLPAENVASALLRRERAGSTAIGEGVAIPHARVKDLDRILALYIRPASPLAFDAPDGQPVSDVLVLLVPSPAAQMHLDMLAQAASLFSHRAFRGALQRSETPWQIKQCFDDRGACA